MLKVEFMEKNNVADVLLALATGKGRSETARLRDIMNEVEAALSAGVRRVSVLEALHSHGFTMSKGTFDTALYRIRKQRKKTQSVIPSNNWISKAGKEPVHSAMKTERGTGAPKAEKPPQNPLIKPTGFNYSGTQGVSADDLI